MGVFKDTGARGCMDCNPEFRFLDVEIRGRICTLLKSQVVFFDILKTLFSLFPVLLVFS